MAFASLNRAIVTRSRLIGSVRLQPDGDPPETGPATLMNAGRSDRVGQVSRTVGALYRTLDRLEIKGYVTSWFGDPTAERGGRSKRYFKVRPAGLRALRESRDALAAMWDGLESRGAMTRGS